MRAVPRKRARAGRAAERCGRDRAHGRVRARPNRIRAERAYQREAAPRAARPPARARRRCALNVNNNEALRRAFAPLGFSVSPAPNDAGLSMGGAYAAVRATRAHAQRTELLGFDVWDDADEAVHAWLRGGADGDAAAAADALLRGRPRPTGASTQRLAEVRSGLRDFARG